MSATAAEPSTRPNTEEIATAAFRLASDGLITDVRPWQVAVYERLANPDNDAGYLLLTPTASGKSEAVLVPSVGLQRGGGPRRVFIIGADGSPLDDYVLRVSPYLKAWAAADETPRTVYIDGEETGQDGSAVRFSADGNVDSEIAISPLEPDVDIVITTFSRFQDLFFGGGGVHGLPSALPLPDEAEIRRDLFFFDEAQSYAPIQFSQFLRLVEFLFAEDTDIVVGSSTMPPSFEEELSFLEKVVVPAEPLPVRIEYRPDADPIAAIAREAVARAGQYRRIALVAENQQQAEALIAALPDELRDSAIRYFPGSASDERRKAYASLLDKNAQYVLVTTGSYLEASNVDVDAVLTTLCLPESLILRAGRCNRCGTRPTGDLLVFGNAIEGARRVLNNAQQTGYLEALAGCDGTPFDPSDWKRFI
jgi:CRISPR-associated endonuclease/helicase Cas3